MRAFSYAWLLPVTCKNGGYTSQNWPKQSNSVKKTQTKGYHAVRGHSRSSKSVLIESSYIRRHISD